MALGWHSEDLGHCLVLLGIIGGGHGVPEGAEWDSHPSGSIVLLESRMPDWRAMESENYAKSNVKC